MEEVRTLALLNKAFVKKVNTELRETLLAGQVPGQGRYSA